MASNRYDQAAQASFINTYVPIPFQQLMTIGEAAGNRLKDTQDYLQNNMNKWWQFRSPSQKDTNTYYNETMGRLKPLLDQYISDPEKMKSAAGQAELRNFINTGIDYNTLSNLEQSKEGLVTRQKVNQQLMLNDRFNPLWHNVNYNDYDTTKSGIYNDISPLAYKSIQELVQPYVDNLKEGYIGKTKNGMYDITGVSRARTKEEVDKNLSSIMNTPEARKHMQVLIDAGMTPEQAQREFVKQAYTASYEFAHENQTPNAYALLNYKQAMEDAQYNRRLASSNSPGNVVNDPVRPMTFTQQVIADSANRNGVLASDAFNRSNPNAYNNYVAAMKEAKGNQVHELQKEYARQVNEFVNRNGGPTKMTANMIFSSMKGNDTVLNGKSYKIYSNKDLNAYTDKFIKATMTPVGGETSNSMVNALPVRDSNLDGKFKGAKIATDGRGFYLKKTFGMQAWGRNSTKSKLEQALSDGKLDDKLIILGGDRHGNFDIPDRTTGGVQNQSKGIYKVAIPYSELRNAGLDYERDIRSQGGTLEKETLDYSTDSKYEGSPQAGTDLVKPTQVNVNKKAKEVYVIIPLVHDIPNPNDGQWANQTDNYHAGNVEKKSNDYGDQAAFIQSVSYDLNNK